MSSTLQQTVIDIWPGMAPGETTSELGEVSRMHDFDILTNVTHPRLTLYSATGASKSDLTVMVLPGGGYEILADEHEGIEIANWFNSLGYSAAILRYRVPKKRDAAFADAQRAIRILKSRASEFGIGARIGVLGFSAGGHLAARLSSRYAYNGYILIDPADQISARPDFTLLIYPAYLIDEKGNTPDEVAPHAGQPPVFVTQTKDDYVWCAGGYAKIATAAGVSVKSAIYEAGGHGYALRTKPDQPVSNWSKEADKWLSDIAGA